MGRQHHYYRRHKRVRFQQGIVLSLDCADLTLSVSVWWKLRKTNVEYGPLDEYDLKRLRWTPKTGRTVKVYNGNP